MENPNISFIIPARNEEGFLPRSILSIKKAVDNKTAYEIIVVDNNSTDNSVLVSKSLGAKVIKNLIPNIARSRNQGAFNAKGDLLAFVDADCLLDPKWYEMVSNHLKMPGIVAVGAKICPDWEDATWVEKTIFKLNKRRGKSKAEGFLRVNWVGTSNLAIRKDDFFEVGGFNEELQVSEDVDLCSKIKRKGDIILDHTVFTIHLRESKTILELFLREFWRGGDCLLQWKKNDFELGDVPSVFGPPAFLLLISLSILAVFYSLLISIVLIFFAAIIPFYLVFRSIENIMGFTDFFKASAVSFVYVVARGFSFVNEFFGRKK